MPITLSTIPFWTGARNGRQIYNLVMLVRLLAALTLAASIAAQAQSSEAVRKEIEAAYSRALDAMQHAKTMDDLDELNRSFDTQDWKSITPGQQPRTWQELRKYGFEGLWAPFQSLEFMMDSINVQGDTAVLTGKLRAVNMKGNVALIPLKETWRNTIIGWKRQIHQKFAPGAVPK